MKKIKTFIQHIKESTSEDTINSLTAETLDQILDAIIKNPKVTSSALSGIKKTAPLLYQRLVTRAKEMGKAGSVGIHTDLGDLGF